MLHDALALLAALLCLAAVISPRIPTGIIGSLGLGTISLAALWSLDDWHDPALVLDIALGGVALIGVKIGWRALRKPTPQLRRMGDLYGQPREVPSKQLHQVTGGRK
jgi:hypothetical protein